MSEHTCNCNHSNLLAEEILDATVIPHTFRHAAILGALAATPVNNTLLLKAPHMPTPLIAQVGELDGEFSHEVVQDGPEAWLIRFRRVA